MKVGGHGRHREQRIRAAALEWRCFMFEITKPEELYKDLFDFRRDFDEIFTRLMTGWPMAKIEPKLLEKMTFTPPVEGWIDPETKKFCLRVSVPGIDPKDVKIVVQNDMLMISGERKVTESKKEVNYLHREFGYGYFERVLPIPEGVDVEKLTAEFNNGVLEITAPVATAALPRRIEIKPAFKKAA